MEPQHIDDLTEILARLRMRLGEIKRGSDPFAGIVLDEIEEHVRLSDNLLCRLATAQARSAPRASPETLAELIGVTEELCCGHSMATAERAHQVVEAVRNQLNPSPKRG